MDGSPWKDPTAASWSVPATSCDGNTEGSSNVDGRCIKGGQLVPSGSASGWDLPDFGAPGGRCAAFPVYQVTHVPYTNGPVVGRNYADLLKLSQT